MRKRLEDGLKMVNCRSEFRKKKKKIPEDTENLLEGSE